MSTAPKTSRAVRDRPRYPHKRGNSGFSVAAGGAPSMVAMRRRRGWCLAHQRLPKGRKGREPSAVLRCRRCTSGIAAVRRRRDQGSLT